jgi:hypothetical protein
VRTQQPDRVMHIFLYPNTPVYINRPTPLRRGTEKNKVRRSTAAAAAKRATQEKKKRARHPQAAATTDSGGAINEQRSGWVNSGWSQ